MIVKDAGGVMADVSFWDKVKALAGKAKDAVMNPIKNFDTVENPYLTPKERYETVPSFASEVKESTVQAVSSVSKKITNVVKIMGVGVLLYGLVKIKKAVQK